MRYQIIIALAVIMVICGVIARYIQTQPVKFTEKITLTARVEVTEITKLAGDIQKIKVKLVEITNNKDIAIQKALSNSTIIVITRRYPEYSYGENLIIKGAITPERIWLYPEIIRTNQSTNNYRTKLHQVRTWFESKITSAIPAPHSTLIIGMLVGTSKSFNEKYEDAFIKTGTIHMIVVSGFNISLVAAAVMRFTGLLPRVAAIILACFTTIIYVGLTGAQPPALRAGIMAIVVLIAQIFGRPVITLWTLVTAIVAMLLVDPQLIHSISFQLSTATTLGIICLPETINKIVAHWFPKIITKEKHILSSLYDSLVISISAQIMASPILILYFGEISLIAPFANLAVSWTIPYIMILGLSVGLAQIISPVITKLLVIATYPFTAYFLQVITLVSRIPNVSYQNIKSNGMIVIGIYTIIASLWLIMQNKKSDQSSEESK